MSDARLGRGLDELLPGEPDDEDSPTGDLRQLPVEAVRPNPNQPRDRFDPDQLEELQQSIESQGVLEPILVRPIPDGGFEIVAGERRWRAAQSAGVSEIPAVVRELDEQQSLALALVENLQREDLTPIEEARGFQRLLEQHEWTQQELADALGTSRSGIANRLRLLSLDEDVQTLVEEQQLSAGHARALASLDDTSTQRSLANQAIEQSWSVRKLEQTVSERESDSSESKTESDSSRPSDSPAEPDPHLEDLRSKLEDAVGTEVEIISDDRKQGYIKMYFDSPEEFETIMDRLGA